MIEPKKRGAAEMAVVPAGIKRPRTELVAAAQSQQLATMVGIGSPFHTVAGVFVKFKSLTCLSF